MHNIHTVDTISEEKKMIFGSRHLWWDDQGCAGGTSASTCNGFQPYATEDYK